MIKAKNCSISTGKYTVMFAYQLKKKLCKCFSFLKNSLHFVPENYEKYGEGLQF